MAVNSLIFDPTPMGEGNTEVRFQKRGSEYLTPSEAQSIAAVAVDGIDKLRKGSDDISPREHTREVRLKKEKGTETGYYIGRNDSDGVSTIETGIVMFDTSDRTVKDHVHTRAMDRKLTGNTDSVLGAHATHTVCMEVKHDGTESVRSVYTLKDGEYSIVITEDENHQFGLRFEGIHSLVETQQAVNDLAKKYGIVIPIYDSTQVVKKGQVVKGHPREGGHPSYWRIDEFDQVAMQEVSTAIKNLTHKGNIE